jgi:glycosyltransferase involved in cell wall biosynthesis
MRVIICNKYYFETGGPERYFFGLTDLLERAGQEVIPFSVRATRNRPTPYAKYFVSPPVPEDAYDYRLTQQPISVGAKVRMARSAIYSREAYDNLRLLIRDTEPDLVYVLNYSTYLSPSIIDAAHDEHVPVVVRLSDYSMICANNNFFRNDHVCTECLDHGKYRGITHRCNGGSLSASMARVGAMYVHDARQIYQRVNAFVAPSRFLQAKIAASGIPAERIHHIPTFVDVSRFRPRPQSEPPGDYMLYFGRIAPEKGLSVLLEAYALLGRSAPALWLMGRAEAAEEAKLRALCAKRHLGNVRFLGPTSGDEMVGIIQHARFAVVPSVCYDNTPNAVYEAFACGLPVVASNIGGLPEQVTHGREGLLFQPNDAAECAQQLRRLLEGPALVASLGANALQTVHQEYSGERHVRQLLELFTMQIDRKGLEPAASRAVSP